MKKPYPHQIPITASGDYVLDRILPRVKVLLEGSPLLTTTELKQAFERALREEFFISDLSTWVMKFHQVRLNDSISGPMGKLSYGHSRKIQNYARRRPQKPPNVTPARLIQQSHMRQAMNAWKSANNDIKTAWNNASKSKLYSGTHLYRGVHIALLIENQPIPDPFLPTPSLLSWYFQRKHTRYSAYSF